MSTAKKHGYRSDGMERIQVYNGAGVVMILHVICLNIEAVRFLANEFARPIKPIKIITACVME
jgi:hypothetical protein